MTAPLTPEAKQQILAAYQKFHATITRIAHDHRTTVKNILSEIDQRQVSKIKKQIGL